MTTFLTPDTISATHRIGWEFTYWPPHLKAVDSRINLKRKRKVNKLNPFRKLKYSITGFKTDSGFDVLFIDKDNKIIGNKMVLK